MDQGRTKQDEGNLWVRPATEPDAAAIATIHVRSWQEAYRHLLPSAFLDGLDIATRADRWRRLIAELPSDQDCWVAGRAARILGFSTGGPTRDDDLPAGSTELYAIYVDPEALGTGVGAGLMARQLEALRPSSPGERCL